MIGNDIIDLNLTRLQSNWQRRGLLQKLFTEEEQEFIKKSNNQELNVWLLWSMKESGYKALQRKYNLNRFYNPKKFVCSGVQIASNRARGVVYFEEEAFSVTANLFSNKILTYTTNTCVSCFSTTKNARSLLLEYIATHFSYPLATINICKNARGIPFLTYLGENLQIPFSLSHHGNFSAYAVSLNMS